MFMVPPQHQGSLVLFGFGKRKDLSSPISEADAGQNLNPKEHFRDPQTAHTHLLPAAHDLQGKDNKKIKGGRLKKFYFTRALWSRFP
jgi:hypothetical protein